MQLLRANRYLCSKAELATIVKARGRVNQHCRRVNLIDKSLGCSLILR
jgi:hypothetical protein